MSIIMTHRASAGQQQSFRLSLLFSFFDRRCTREDDGQTRAADIIPLSIISPMYERQRGAQLLVFLYYFHIIYTRERRTLAVCAGRRRRRRRELCFSLRFVSRPRRWSLRLRTDRTEKIYKLKKKNHQLLLLLLLVNL